MFRWFWQGVWNLSEFTGIGLGRFAPFVLGQAIGAKPKRVDKERSITDEEKVNSE